MLRKRCPCILLLMVMMWVPDAAQAHFIWLVRTSSDGGDQLCLYFSELAEADDPVLLDRVADVQGLQITAAGQISAVKFSRGSESLLAQLAGAPDESMFVLSHDLGVMSRGGDTFLLRYYAKTGPELGHQAWKRIDCGKQLSLDLIPERDGDKVRVGVNWHGEPLRGAQVKVNGPGIEAFEAESDAQGHVAFTVGNGGIYSIRARHIEAKGGESGSDEYTSTRHYSTLALAIPAAAAGNKTPADTSSATTYPPLPEMVTSFGAAIVQDALYVYGGHTGRAHAYYAEAQADTLRRLDLKNPQNWESLGRGPGLQGLAMVGHGGKLYRIGGFIAKNKDGQEHDLWSLADVACYDPATNQWTEMSPLPQPRSSFDAAVLGDKIYVVGGWQIAGDAENVWHRTAYALDLAEVNPRWQALPEPPLQRRALSVAAHADKIYAIGGMQREGGPTTRVDVFDPATGSWSEGPRLQGEPMDGFGSSAFATGGRLYVTTYSGKLQRLANDGTSWEVVRQLERARFFHRLLPLSSTQLITLGGASMEEGKFEEVDLIDVARLPE